MQKLGIKWDEMPLFIFSCFQKGCPTKPYAKMPKGIVGNGVSWSLIEALVFQEHRGKQHKQYCIYAFSFLFGKHRKPQSINGKLFVPLIPIGIVTYAFTLLWDNLCEVKEKYWKELHLHYNCNNKEHFDFLTNK